MGKASRWLKSIFGVKSSKDQKEFSSDSGDRRGKQTSCFGHSARDSGGGLCHNPETIPPNITAAEAAWLQSYYSQSEKEQNKHAIAVAAASAAAADAAVAAAQAAAAVVKLTNQGRGIGFCGGRETWAAMKIQTTFRGYLARKARRALKALVKLQAIVRGYLVRKQATATLHGMQALIRAQATVRSKRAQGFIKNEYSITHHESRSRRSTEIFDDSRSETSASIHSRRLYASFQSKTISPVEDAPKVLEVDTGRPRSGSRRSDTPCYESREDPSYHSLPWPFPSHLSIPSRLNHHHHEWASTGDDWRFSTAQSTPRCTNPGDSSPPLTPAKSASADNFFLRISNYPNYMADTASFKGKLRSQSAPKQRPETGSKKRTPLNETMESRNSLSGVRMHRSCSQAQEVINFKNAVMGKLDRSSEFLRQPSHRYYAPTS
ncbi:hypothetical protein Nepgr_005184 [Nepenthes gracilis]|uniref:DUF4005 domain-containing protein n=1 Tax=Nepenthes gracilis TaxID=150966 RepID=A0AAD3XG39_NEPGR|nr:hypothetical protein Nepgr_005184 [Nepenthes gracilis]